LSKHEVKISRLLHSLLVWRQQNTSVTLYRLRCLFKIHT